MFGLFKKKEKEVAAPAEITAEEKYELKLRQAFLGVCDIAPLSEIVELYYLIPDEHKQVIQNDAARGFNIDVMLWLHDLGVEIDLDHVYRIPEFKHVSTEEKDKIRQLCKKISRKKEYEVIENFKRLVSKNP